MIVTLQKHREPQHRNERAACVVVNPKRVFGVSVPKAHTHQKGQLGLRHEMQQLLAAQKSAGPIRFHPLYGCMWLKPNLGLYPKNCQTKQKTSPRFVSILDLWQTRRNISVLLFQNNWTGTNFSTWISRVPSKLSGLQTRLHYCPPPAPSQREPRWQSGCWLSLHFTSLPQSPARSAPGFYGGRANRRPSDTSLLPLPL